MLRIWSEQWKAPEEWLRRVELMLLSRAIPVCRSGDFDSWDLETRTGLAGTARLKLAVEEHGAGKQMLLFQVRPYVTRFAAVVSLLFTGVSALAFFNRDPWLGMPLALFMILVLIRIITDCSAAAAILHDSVESLGQQERTPSDSVVGVVYLGSS